MSHTNQLEQLVAIVKNMRAAQRDYWAKGRTTIAECKRFEAACDQWLQQNGYTEQRTLFEASGTPAASGTAATTSRK